MINTSELLKPELNILDSDEPIDFVYVKQQSVMCFGQEIQPPKKKVKFLGYIPKNIISKEDIEGIESIKLFYHPIKGSKRIITLIYGENKNQEVTNKGKNLGQAQQRKHKFNQFQVLCF